MKIVVFTDIHANYPALRAALSDIQSEGYDAMFSLGDTIAIGPFPNETLDLLLSMPNLHCLMGNHDALFAQGLPDPAPEYMRDSVVAHHRWTHSCLDEELRHVMMQWPYQAKFEFEGTWTSFLHYEPADTPRGLAPAMQSPTADDLDHLFTSDESELLFYGHEHHFSDIQGRVRYINPGSLGCNVQAIARYTVVHFESYRFTVTHRQVPYDDTELHRAFETRRVPNRESIYDIFFGSRFADDSEGALTL